MSERVSEIDRILTEVYRPVLKSDFYLAYFGVFTDDITEHLIAWVQEQLAEETDVKKNNIKKTSFLLAETYQNLVRHKIQIGETLNHRKREFPEGFQININKGFVQIVSTNKISIKDSDLLESTIKEVASKSKEDLKTLWKERLTNEGYTENGGAGLGLIEISRKIDHPLEYSFKEIENGYRLFSMNVNFNISNSVTDEKLDKELFDQLYRNQVKYKAIFGFKGVMNPRFFQIVISIIETQFNSLHMTNNQHDSNLIVARKSLMNFKEFGKLMAGQVRGYFGLGLDGNRYFLNFGYFIETELVVEEDGELLLRSDIREKEKSFFAKHADESEFVITNRRFNTNFISYSVFLKPCNI